MPARYLKVKEASAMLRVSDAAIYRWIRAGLFSDAVVRLGGGGTLRIDEKGFLDELALMRNKPGRPSIVGSPGQELHP
jgi:hypothetical protein